jgi:hypothetical protein
MKAYKGFDKDLKCRGYQFAEGESYEEPKAEVCVTGFHAVTNPLDALAYYVPADGSRYCEVEVDDDAKTHADDSKVASRHISIGVELGLPGLIKAGLTFVWDKVEKVRATKPDQFSDGYQSTAATSGYQSTAATSGYQSTAATSGDQSTAATSGKESLAVAAGYDCTAKGIEGCWLVLVEREDSYYDGGHILGVKSVRVDGKQIKPGVAYRLVAGKVVQA